MLQQSPADGGAKSRGLVRFAWLPPLVLMLVMAGLWIEDARASYESARVLLVLNFLCTTLVSLFIAILAGRSFLASGQPALLMLCCAMLVWATAALVAAAGNRVGNYNITIHNLGVFVSALCHLAGIGLTVQSRRPLRGTGGILALACTGALTAVGLIWLATLEGWLPVFFVDGRGGTPLRDSILFLSAVIFGVSAVWLWSRYRHSGSEFLHWYALGLALVAVGTIGLMLQTVHGSILGWTARSAQYLGGVYLLIGAASAVRESRRWELSLAVALEQIKDEYELLFQSINDGVVLHKIVARSAAGEFVRANDVLCRLLGCAAVEVSQLVPLDVLVPDFVDTTAATARHPAGRVHERTLRTCGGRVILVEVSTREFEHRGQRMVLSVIRDVTERKQAEEALHEANRRKDEFLATLAHELRNPLAPLRNGLQVMTLAADDPQVVARARAMMERQLAQMVHLVDDLLDVARISQGKLELRKQHVNIETVVTSALETCDPLIRQGGHELTVTLPEQPVWVDADATRLAQALANLLSNAAKYTERGGRVWLTVELQGSDVVVTVKDNGVGISPAMLPRIFDMFTQADRSFERSQGGLGIGLSLTKQLIELHGGSIEARSAGQGKGSEFLVRFPMVTPAPSKPIDPPKSIQRTFQWRIVVADDNVDAAASLATLLTLMGNEVRTASDGLQALDVAAALRPHLIVLDIGMPKMDGYEACRRIREQPWGRKVLLVALTGWGQDEDRRRSHEAGFDHHLVKPVAPVEIEKLLARVSADGMTGPA